MGTSTGASFRFVNDSANVSPPVCVLFAVVPHRVRAGAVRVRRRPRLQPRYLSQPGQPAAFGRLSFRRSRRILDHRHAPKRPGCHRRRVERWVFLWQRDLPDAGTARQAERGSACCDVVFRFEEQFCPQSWHVLVGGRAESPPGYVRLKVYTEPKGPDAGARRITRNILERMLARGLRPCRSAISGDEFPRRT